MLYSFNKDQTKGKKDGGKKNDSGEKDHGEKDGGEKKERRKTVHGEKEDGGNKKDGGKRKGGKRKKDNGVRQSKDGEEHELIKMKELRRMKGERESASNIRVV